MKIQIGNVSGIDNIKPAIYLDIPSLADTRMLIQGNSGAGKSWLMRLMAERIERTQILIMDPEGEFGTVRKLRDDFLLVGGDGAELHADTKSAALLARKLAELNVSAVLDLYELKLSERRLFIKLFFTSLMNIPKPLWHTILVFIDEAHLFCLDSETEILGANGWLKWNKVHKGTEVVAFNLESGKYLNEAVQHTLQRHHSGKMVRLGAGKRLNRLALHGTGIALVFARTDTASFFTEVWPVARCLLFIRAAG